MLQLLLLLLALPLGTIAIISIQGALFGRWPGWLGLRNTPLRVILSHGRRLGVRLGVMCGSGSSSPVCRVVLLTWLGWWGARR